MHDGGKVRRNLLSHWKKRGNATHEVDDFSPVFVQKLIRHIFQVFPPLVPLLVIVFGNIVVLIKDFRELFEDFRMGLNLGETGPVGKNRVPCFYRGEACVGASAATQAGEY